MKQNANFIILHGFTGSPKDNFFPWLRAELERRGYKVQAPELPETNNPKIDEQVDFVVDKIKIDENSVILGHSLGAVVAMKVVERLKHPIAKLILAAGFIEPTFKDHKRPFEKTFDWKFDFEKIKKNTGSTIYLRASNDYAVPFEQGDKISNLLNAKIVDFVANEEHICGTHEPVVFDACVDKVRVFTTRADTLFGCAYIVIAPESDYTSNLKSQISNLEEVEKYIENAGKKSDLERTELQKEKTGIRLEGVKAINPINNEEVDVWVADYVLSTYGTGAVMAVPAHDERDFEFAKKYNLLIKEVVIPFEGEEHKGAEFRKTVSAVVHRRSDDKYLIVKWKKFDWFAPSIGGMEKDETPMQAVEREVFEETGYKVKAVEELGGQIESHFYAENKQVWRARIDQPVLCELRDKTPREVSKEELELHEAVWMTANEALQKITHPYNKIGFERYTKKNYAYIGYGKLVNSGEFSGIYSKEAIEAITKKIKKDGNGDFAVNYKLRDWVFSRQHYWGEPIPIIYCEKCGIIPLNESDLPLELPDVKKYEPSNTGESPLAAVSEWVDIKCPRCSGPARRETDTMPNWAGSSWYYLAYIMLGKEKEKIKKQKNGTVNVFDEFKKELEYWLPVDLYNGGMEHTTLHLLYSRFWHKFLYDLKEVPTSEPYQKRIAHGIILGPDGQKMSKSRGNVIIPDDIVSTYGADTMRAYIMFIGPYDQESAWSVAGLQGVFRFLNRVWKNVGKVKEGIDDPKDLLVDLNKYIVSVTDDLENFRLNTYVAKLMEINNEIDSLETVSKDSFGIFLKLLSPAAPHLAEELWEKIGGSESILDQTWPKADAKYLILDYVKIAVQVNGKLRGVVEVGSKATQEEVLDIVRKNSVIANWIKGREIVKVIYRPEKVMSLVIK
ncbi:MAG: class I tRNA ligase family protein [bacterium]|nr:class I tRNA ligase family protein [bacterium]